MKLRGNLLFFIFCAAASTQAFLAQPIFTRESVTALPLLPLSFFENDESTASYLDSNQRREAFNILVGAAMTLPLSASAEENMYAPKFVQEYDDFKMTKEGWSFREVKPGTGQEPDFGDRVVFDWSGYTIGYFGRPFEAKGGPQGGAFDKDLDYSRTELGSGKMVKGLECAMKSMKPGGIRQVLVPYGPLGYPEDDPTHARVGPKPTTFSGQRALNFVLDNPRVDRTMLFNVKLVRVDKSDGRGGFIRGDKRT